MIRIFLVACVFAAQCAAAELEHLQTFQWTYNDTAFGGLSGLWVSPDGSRIASISDRGHYAEGRIERTDGRITDIQVDRFEPLPGRDKPTVTGILRDAEGLAIDSNGRRFVSFEGNPRIWRYDTFTTKPEWTHKWDRFWKLQRNSGLEALAIDADDTIYAIPERSGKWERPFPVYRLKNGAWDDQLRLPREGKFLVVGADFGPDGKLYLLERQFEWIGGFRNRIRRFSMNATGFDVGETLLETRVSGYDNLEGISVWTDLKGDTIVSLVSDDNFSVFQSSQIVEFKLVP